MSSKEGKCCSLDGRRSGRTYRKGRKEREVVGGGRTAKGMRAWDSVNEKGRRGSVSRIMSQNRAIDKR